MSIRQKRKKTMSSDSDILVSVTWDTTTDEYPEGQPGIKTQSVIAVPEHIYFMDHDNNFDTDYVSDYLSDEYGWCVKDWIEY